MFNLNATRNKRGQALVEVAILLPILLLILMGIFEFGRVFNAYLIINHASREGARSAALGNDDTEIINKINASIFYLDSAKLTIVITPSKSSRTRGTDVTVNLKYNIDIIVPIIENLVPNPFPLEAQTVMRVE